MSIVAMSTAGDLEPQQGDPGQLWVLYHVDCGDCPRKSDLQVFATVGHGYRQAEKEATAKAIRRGWRWHQGAGWLCPPCTEARRLAQ